MFNEWTYIQYHINQWYWTYVQLIEHNFAKTRTIKTIAYFTYTIFEQHCTQSGTMVRLVNVKFTKTRSSSNFKIFKCQKNLMFVDVGMSSTRSHSNSLNKQKKFWFKKIKIKNEKLDEFNTKWTNSIFAHFLQIQKIL